MNYAEARQLKGEAGWHFTVRNDDRIWAHQCCCTMVPATMDDVARTQDIYHGTLKVGDLVLGPPHEPHATKEEAEECFHQWRLRQKIRLDGGYGNWESCEVCGEPTKKGAAQPDIGGARHVALCDKHLNEESVRSLMKRVTECIYS